MIIWIASYPKSGNTWVRSFLSHYLFSKNKDFDFSLLKKIPTFPDDHMLNFLRKKYNGKFQFTDLASHWDLFQTKIGENKNILLKTHNALVTIKNHSFTSLKHTIGLIYLIRDPRDVVISYAKHTNNDFNKTFENMKIDAVEKTEDNLDKTFLSSWSNHFYSWKAIPLKKIVIRYEDLIDDPEKEFSKIVKYLSEITNIKYDQKKIVDSIEATNFSKLKKLEDDKNFPEIQNSNKKTNFFREGVSRQWERNLSKDLIEKIQMEFAKAMKENFYEF